MCGKIPLNKGKRWSAKDTNYIKTCESVSGSDSEESGVKLDTIRVNLHVLNLVQSEHDPLLTKDPWFTELNIQGVNLKLEIDSGAPVTVLPELWYKKYFSDIKLEKSKLVLSTWSNEIVKPKGYILVRVSKGKVSKVLRAILAPNNYQALCGREWIQALGLDWKQSDKIDHIKYGKRRNASDKSTIENVSHPAKSENTSSAFGT